MEDRDFFDVLYQGWAKTTGAENMFWMPEESEDFPGLWDIVAVNEKQERKPLASFLTEEDSAFITAVHGCFGDLVRRLHAAVDEAERLDEQRDDQEFRIAELAIENEELRERIAQLEDGL
ncbi:hypothetical protein [Mycobacterium intracellulare]|uniref:Uncharacterized protein n=1 Tax=Mycobacterium intracellulare TaxID=1767 RepID=A0AAE4UCG5_MYCIT|nr:hypothetical protein [Mycobacterium intracellulare]MDV6975275.1 hypothetical protein [Mycobacterium intracellulare]MDV6980339.1 hypothetical protein [Mycobacterium intracellulare]MDV7010768.1 hypothetical protein [Mycobacterium intracellulare]MDV7025674.1 hypothetical protein [Mycobacterium intracellulare]